MYDLSIYVSQFSYPGLLSLFLLPGLYTESEDGKQFLKTDVDVLNLKENEVVVVEIKDWSWLQLCLHITHHCHYTYIVYNIVYQYNLKYIQSCVSLSMQLV